MFVEWEHDYSVPFFKKWNLVYKFIKCLRQHFWAENEIPKKCWGQEVFLFFPFKSESSKTILSIVFFSFNFDVVLRIEPRASSLTDPHPQSSALDFVLRQGLAKFARLDLNLWFSYLSLPNSGIITLHYWAWLEYFLNTCKLFLWKVSSSSPPDNSK